MEHKDEEEYLVKIFSYSFTKARPPICSVKKMGQLKVLDPKVLA